MGKEVQPENIGESAYVFEIDINTKQPAADILTIYDNIQFHNWFYSENIKGYFSDVANTDRVSDTLQDYYMGNSRVVESTNIIPVGGLNFVSAYLGKHIKPIDISRVDRKFTGREIQILSYDEMTAYLDRNGPRFIKSATKCKEFPAGKYDKNSIESIEKSINYLHKSHRFMISELIHLLAEWRLFIHKGKILDCKQYMGSWESRFDEAFVKEMVASIPKSIIPYTSYTVDIGLTDANSTVLIEAHNFISCGLYGFEHPNLYKMVKTAYLEEKAGLGGDIT